MATARPNTHRHTPPPYTFADSIVPSIESPRKAIRQLSPSASGHSQTLLGFGHIPKKPSRSRIIQQDVELDYPSGKRRRLADVEPPDFTNIDSTSRQRTVLIPLDQYKDYNEKGASSFAVRVSEGTNPSRRTEERRLLRPVEPHRERPIMKEATRPVSGESHRLPAEIFAADQLYPQSYPRPHLQVQLDRPPLSSVEASPFREFKESDSRQVFFPFHSDHPILPDRPSGQVHFVEGESSPSVQRQRAVRMNRSPATAIPRSLRYPADGDDHSGVIFVPQYPGRSRNAASRDPHSPNAISRWTIHPPEGHGLGSSMAHSTEYQRPHNAQMDSYGSDGYPASVFSRREEQHYHPSSISHPRPKTEARPPPIIQRYVPGETR